MGKRGGRGRERIFSLYLSQIIVILQVNPPEGKRTVTDWKTIVLFVEPGKICSVQAYVFAAYVYSY